MTASRIRGIAGTFVSLALGALLVLPTPAAARSATYPSKDAALIMDAVSGHVLYERHADAKRYPASLTKMMTLYLLFQKLRSGEMNLDTVMPVSRHAAGQAPTKLYLKPGETITVKKAIQAIVIRSANDVAVVIAEAVGGSEPAFVRMMNAEAQKLGMDHTHYHNASGLPDRRQVTTARDMATMARHLAYDFPQYYPFFALDEFTFRGRTYDTHNNLIGVFKGTDGIKTGYTRMSGFNLVTSVVRNHKNVLGVVMGGRTAASRDHEMMRLLATAFHRIENKPTLVAYANVPWHDNSGPKIYPDFDRGNAHPQVQMASLVEPQGPADVAVPIARRDVIADNDVIADPAPKPDADQGNAPVQMASLEPQGPANVAVPIARRDVIADSEGTDDPAPYDKVYEDDQANDNLVASVADNTDNDNATVGVDGGSSVPATQLAAVLPTPRPKILDNSLPTAGDPTPLEQGDIGGLSHPAASSDAKDWTVQIGAFSDEHAAEAQLANYAERSMDVVGQANRIVVPLASGHRTLYRARFGLFVESEARAVCKRMMARGETCYAAQQGG